MGTAVLHPQDCLPPSQSQSNRRLPLATARTASVCSNAAMDSCVRHGSAENRGILGHRASSAGLLPLPDHVPQVAYPPPPRPAAKFSPPSYKRCRSPTSGYGFAIPLQRYSSSSRDLHSHGRRKSACNDLGNAAPVGVPKVIETGGLPAHLAIAPVANCEAHFPRLYSDANVLKWSKQCKLSEASQPVSHLSTGVTKQIFDDAANVRTLSTWKSSKTSPMKHGGENRKLNCFPSGKTQQKEKIYTAVSCNQQVAGKLAKCLSNMSALACLQNERGTGSPGFSAFNKENKTGISPLQGSLCGKSDKKYMNSGSSPLAGRSSSPRSQFVDASERTREITSQESPFKIMGMRNTERSHQCSPSGLIGQDGAIGEHGSIFPQVAACNSANFNWPFRTKDVLRCLESAYDTGSWLSMVDEGWAGPSFSISPPPSSLPVPRFTSKLLKTAPTTSSLMKGEASLFSGAPPPETERAWDIARATKDLRRLLHLDHACCDV